MSGQSANTRPAFSPRTYAPTSSSTKEAPATMRAATVRRSAGPTRGAGCAYAATTTSTSTAARIMAVAKCAVTSSGANVPFTTMPPRIACTTISATARMAAGPGIAPQYRPWVQLSSRGIAEDRMTVSSDRQAQSVGQPQEGGDQPRPLPRYQQHADRDHDHSAHTGEPLVVAAEEPQRL